MEVINVLPPPRQRSIEWKPPETPSCYHLHVVTVTVTVTRYVCVCVCAYECLAWGHNHNISTPLSFLSQSPPVIRPVTSPRRPLPVHVAF